MGYFSWLLEGKTPQNAEYEFLDRAFHIANLIFQWVSVLCLIPLALIILFEKFRFGLITFSMLWIVPPIYFIILIKRTVKFARTKRIPHPKHRSTLGKSLFIMNQLFPSVLFSAALCSLYLYNSERLINLSFLMYGLFGILLYFMVVMTVATSEKTK